VTWNPVGIVVGDAFADYVQRLRETDRRTTPRTAETSILNMTLRHTSGRYGGNV